MERGETRRDGGRRVSGGRAAVVCVELRRAQKKTQGEERTPPTKSRHSPRLHRRSVKPKHPSKSALRVAKERSHASHCKYYIQKDSGCITGRAPGREAA